jgi:hypothetical protein
VRPASAALTVSPAWGISAAPGRDEAFGRGGPWEAECAEVERAYGPGSTIHVSLEEFARTLPTALENRERFREGGVAARELGARSVRSRADGELATFRAAFFRYRGFDRPNVAHLFAGFERNAAFGREFPSAVQVGPLWPRRYAPRRSRAARSREWVWYASPPSAQRLAVEVRAGLAGAKEPRSIFVRSPRPWDGFATSEGIEVDAGPLEPAAWERRFADADVRIVTGSRTLLEAIELGRPFLYFNGALGAGPRSRRHRPEKIAALLSLLHRTGVDPGVRRDLADFARGRRVREVVRHAADRTGGWSRFPAAIRPVGYPPAYGDAGRLIVRTARALARRPGDATSIVARLRSGSPL